MNVNQIIDMVVRMVMRRIIGKGVNAGMDFAANRMRKPADGRPEPQPKQDPTRKG